MLLTTNARPAYSVILLMDRSVAIIPESMKSQLLAMTPSCIAVGTLSEHDGETHISLSDDILPALPMQKAVCDSVVETPSKVLSICTVLDEVLLEIRVPQKVTRLRIWVNSSSEPDRIVVVATAPDA